MKKLLLSGLVCSLLFLTACFSSRLTTNTGTYNAASPANSASSANSVNSASLPATTATSKPDISTTTTAAVPDEYKDVKDQECALYLKSLKVLTDCKTVTDAQRKQFFDTYAKSLETFKSDIPNADAQKMRASICSMNNKVIQPLVTKCKS